MNKLSCRLLTCNKHFNNCLPRIFRKEKLKEMWIWVKKHKKSSNSEVKYKVLSNFVSWGNIWKGQRNIYKGFLCSFLFMSNYIESSYKKDSMVTKTKLELCPQTWWKLKRWLKTGLTLSNVLSLNPIKLVSSLWNLHHIKLHHIYLYQSLVYTAISFVSFVTEYGKQRLAFKYLVKKKHARHCMHNSKQLCA